MKEEKEKYLAANRRIAKCLLEMMEMKGKQDPHIYFENLVSIFLSTLFSKIHLAVHSEDIRVGIGEAMMVKLCKDLENIDVKGILAALKENQIYAFAGPNNGTRYTSAGEFKN